MVRRDSHRILGKKEKPRYTDRGIRTPSMKRTRAKSRATPRVRVNAITPFLWFDHDAEEAARFYVSIFRGSRISHVRRMADPADLRKKKVLLVEFELAGQPIIALNGGPAFPPTSAFSLYVSCSTQSQVDSLWTRLLRGGKEVQCGWLEDRFGLSWQIIPDRLTELLSDPNPDTAGRAMAAMMKMKKIDLPTLERAVARR